MPIRKLAQILLELKFPLVGISRGIDCLKRNLPMHLNLQFAAKEQSLT